MIKYLDLKKINGVYKDELNRKFSTILDSGNFILGKQVEEFENSFAKYCGAKYCIGVGSGLDALVLTFQAFINLGKLNKGDKVMVPANTFYATILSILNAGLKPVLIEPDKNTFNISPADIRYNLTPEIKAIVPVHLYGQLVNMEIINDLAKKEDILIIEDAAQAHGAENTLGQKAGNMGHAAAFSFYPTKNLGALGDAGAITTNDHELANELRILRNYGSFHKYLYDRLGVNSRLDELQACFLNIKLNYLDRENNKRRFLASRYLAQIKNEQVKLPYFSGLKDHIFYAFVVMVQNREKFVKYLENNNIETNIHYPIPPMNQKALESLADSLDPVSKLIHEQAVSLPLNSSLTEKEISTIISVINNY